jgi:hypothetical protein
MFSLAPLSTSALRRKIPHRCQVLLRPHPPRSEARKALSSPQGVQVLCQPWLNRRLAAGAVASSILTVPDPVEVERLFECAECGRRSELAVGWRALWTDDEPPAVVVFFPSAPSVGSATSDRGGRQVHPEALVRGIQNDRPPLAAPRLRCDGSGSSNSLCRRSVSHSRCCSAVQPNSTVSV